MKNEKRYIVSLEVIVYAENDDAIKKQALDVICSSAKRDGAIAIVRSIEEFKVANPVTRKVL